MDNLEFAVKKDTLQSGVILYTPVCREKVRFSIFNKPWNRIVKLYDRYELMELDFEPKLTEWECEQHIQGYKDQLQREKANEVKTVEFRTLEKLKA